MTAVARYSARTDTGKKRRRNEDAFVLAPPLFAVADGMGGAQAGEIASSLAAAALKERGDDDGGGEERVAELIQEANRRVHQRALDDEAASGMGTTMTVALFEPAGSVAIGHVGDSRAYLLRDGKLDQLTDDHSLVAELVRRGELSPEEAEVHPQRSVITRALGTDPDVDVDTFTVQAHENDVFLICSDGLTTMVDVGTITSIVESGRHDLVGAARALVKEANERGGDDNITVVLFEIAEGEPDDETRELAAIESPDEDTLHPEPGGGGGSADGDTSIVSVEDIRSALEAERGNAAAAEETEETPRASLVQYTLA
ncbi:MAG TPA: Stp1/IreP family PP2C-type Ser/Thr phosphatase, partial [Gaiellaceae bacterium]|nr:Stp1/IreP family PP2C-type Ser/Thr phosphatase [Gaiellaceae bacterium]